MTIIDQVTTRPATRPQADRALFERLAEPEDPVDRDAVIERFLPLARTIAARYARHGEPLDDLFQVACIGLLKAVDRFDPARGPAFSSFAVPTIAGEIKRHYRDHTWSVHVNRDLKDLALDVDQARALLERRLAHSPTVRQIAEWLELDEELVVEALQARSALQASSLDARVGPEADAPALVDQLAVEDDCLARAETRTDLRALLRTLGPLDRLIFHLRFREDLTQRQIGERLGMTQMQVSRRLRHAVELLRRSAQEHDGGRRADRSGEACAAGGSA